MHLSDDVVHMKLFFKTQLFKKKTSLKFNHLKG